MSALQHLPPRVSESSTTLVAVNHIKLINRCVNHLHRRGYTEAKFFMEPSLADLVFRQCRNWKEARTSRKNTCFFISVFPGNKYNWTKNYAQYSTVLMERHRKVPSSGEFVRNFYAWLNAQPHREDKTLVLVCPDQGIDLHQLQCAGWKLVIWDFQRNLDKITCDVKHPLDNVFCSLGNITNVPALHTVVLQANTELSHVDIVLDGTYNVNWSSSGHCRIQCYDSAAITSLHSTRFASSP